MQTTTQRLDVALYLINIYLMYDNLVIRNCNSFPKLYYYCECTFLVRACSERSFYIFPNSPDRENLSFSFHASYTQSGLKKDWLLMLVRHFFSLRPPHNTRKGSTGLYYRPVEARKPTVGVWRISTHCLTRVWHYLRRGSFRGRGFPRLTKKKW